MSDFIKGLGAHRARLVENQGAGPKKGVEQPDLQQPDVQPNGRPAPTKKGLSGAMMRRTVGDVFAAAEKLDIPGRIVARYLAGIGELTPQLEAMSKAVGEAVARLNGKDADLVRTIPSRLITAMSNGLGKLDPATSGRTLGLVLGAAKDIVGAPKAPTAAQVNALEIVAYAASHIDGAGMGPAFAKTAKLVAAERDRTTLMTLGEVAIAAAPFIAGSEVAEGMFVATIKAVLAGLKVDGDPLEIARLVAGELKANLSEGQLGILAAQITTARENRQAFAAAEEQAAAALVQRNEAFEAKFAGDEWKDLRAIRDRAVQGLEPTAIAKFFEVVLAHGERGHDAVVAVASAVSGLLGKSPAALQGSEPVAAQIAAIAAHGVGLPALEALTGRAIRQIDHNHLPAVLMTVDQILTQLEEGGVLEKVIANAGPDGIAKLMSPALVDVSTRVGAQDAPVLASILAAIRAAAGDPQALAHALANAPAFSVAIPRVENGPVVGLLRDNFAADLMAIAGAKLDASVVDATWPRLPDDSIARLLAIGVKQNANLDDWLTDLDKLFATSRGNKDHARNLRTLLACIDSSGGNPVDFVRAINKSKLRMADVSKLANLMLTETAYGVLPEYVAAVLEMVKKGQNPATAIEQRMNAQMVEKLNLGQLLQGAGDVVVTQKGLADVQGPLASLFSNGAGQATVNQEVLKGLLEAALADKVDAFRFQTKPFAAQLACLDQRQRALWMEPQVMTHIRFQGDGEAVFNARVERTALIAKAILERLTEAWGDVEDLAARRNAVVGDLRQLGAEPKKARKELEAKIRGLAQGMQAERDALVKELRELNKNDKAARRELVRKIDGLQPKIAALDWISGLANLAPDNVTPERFVRLADPIEGFRRLLGPALKAGLDELAWTIRLSGVSYSQVTTDDSPDLTTMYGMTVDRNKTGACLNWPGTGGEGMAYWTDPNKRMIITINEAGEERRVMLRICERQDEGHAGEPMLIIEKSYPDASANQEEKRRLIEHMLRRASAMGIACGFATEYYWDASKTSRFQGRADADMNAILQDLSKKYGTSVEKKEMKLLTRMGNTALEYLDSDPPQGQRGVRTYRGWHHNFQQDHKVFENEFIVLQPKEG
jgi:hypothetical protein